MEATQPDETSVARIEAWLVLGPVMIICAAAGIALTVSDELSSQARLVRSAPWSAIGCWCLQRWPDRRLEISDPRPLFRRRRGSHFAARASSVAANGNGLVSPALSPGRYGRRRLGFIVTGVLAALAAWGAAAVAGNVDRFGELTLVGLIGYLLFGAFAFLAIRAAIFLTLASRAVTIHHDRIVLGAAAGYAPSKPLSLSDIRSSTQFGREIVIVSGTERVDVIDLTRFRDADRLAVALGATPIRTVDEGVRTEAAMPFLDNPDGRQVIGADNGAGVERGDVGRRHVREEGLEPENSRPTDRDLSGARHQWRVRRRALIVAALATSVACGWLSVGYVQQRSANDELLADGREVVATVTDVDRSSRGPDSITVEFRTANGLRAGTIHSGWFRGFSRGLQGRSVVVLFDDEDPDLVRLRESRNIHPMFSILAISSGFIAIGLIQATRASTQVQRLLESSAWRRGRFRVRELGRGSYRLDLSDPSGRTLLSKPVVGVRHVDRRTSTASFTSGRRWTVVVPDDAERAFLVRHPRWMRR